VGKAFSSSMAMVLNEFNASTLFLPKLFGYMFFYFLFFVRDLCFGNACLFVFASVLFFWYVV
jgi:hypothetical protein